MPGESADLTELEPFVVQGDPDTEEGFEGFEVTVHPKAELDDGESGLTHRRWLIDNPDEHVHPHQDEHIRALVGEYAVDIDGTTHRLSEGEEITVPGGTPHRHWNPTEHPIRVHHWHDPPLEVADHAETMWALAQAGRTNEKGIPNPLQFAVITHAYPDMAYTSMLPIWAQKTLFALLAPVGRLLGFEAEYTREDVADLR